MSEQLKHSTVNSSLTFKPLALVLAGLLSASSLSMAASGPQVVGDDARTGKVLQAPEFDKVDADDNGELSAQELRRHYQQQLDNNDWSGEQVISRYDTNNSGGLNPPEYQQLLSTMIDQRVAKIKNNAQQRAMQTDTQRQAQTASQARHNPYNPEQSTERSGEFQAAQGEPVSELKHQALDQLDGVEVVNRNGEDIGSVDKVISENGRITDLVVSIGGFMGLGDKEVLVEAEGLLFTGDKVVWNTPVNKDLLDNMPEYQGRDKVSSIANEGVQNSVSAN
jgi:sporulation protein YlmC with PRC-barrel domain